MTSWKTTLGGSVTALGASLMGAGALDWLDPKHRYPLMLAGFVATVLGPFLAGLFARDNDKSSQDVGIRPQNKNSPIPAAALVAGLGLTLLTGACTTEKLAPGADPVVVYAERTAKISLALANGFVVWEMENRPALSPKVTAAADTVRANFPQAFWEFRKLTKIYKLNRTPENRANLATAQAILERIIQTIRNYSPASVQEKAEKATKPITL